MSLETQVMDALKTAMKSKDTVALEALRAVKSALLLAKTSSSGNAGISEKEEMAILQKLVKQRKESAAIYTQQNRAELAEPELAQAAVIEQFLPKQLSEEALKKILSEIISQTGATSMKDMGKVMGLASQKLTGQADGQTLSRIVKELLA